MVVTLNSALTSNSRGAYNPSMINFGENKLKNTTYLKEAPRTEVKHASKFARTAAKFMLGAMGLLSMSACSGSDDTPYVPKTADKTVLELFTEQTDAVGITNGEQGQLFDSEKFINPDGSIGTTKVNYDKTTNDTLFTDEKLDDNTRTEAKTYKNPNTGGLTEKDITYNATGKIIDRDECEVVIINKNSAKPTVVTSVESYDVYATKGAKAKTVDLKYISKEGKTLGEGTLTVLGSTTRAATRAITNAAKTVR